MNSGPLSTQDVAAVLAISANGTSTVVPVSEHGETVARSAEQSAEGCGAVRMLIRKSSSR